MNRKLDELVQTESIEQTLDRQTAHIRSEVPPWKHEGARRDLGGFNLQQGKIPLVIPRDQALRIYYELEQQVLVTDTGYERLDSYPMDETWA